MTPEQITKLKAERDILKAAVWNNFHERKEAADHIIAQREQIEALQKRVKAARGALGDIFDGEPQWPNKPKKELTWCRKRAEEAYYAIGDAP